MSYTIRSSDLAIGASLDARRIGHRALATAVAGVLIAGGVALAPSANAAVQVTVANRATADVPVGSAYTNIASKPVVTGLLHSNGDFSTGTTNGRIRVNAPSGFEFNVGKSISIAAAATTGGVFTIGGATCPTLVTTSASVQPATSTYFEFRICTSTGNGATGTLTFNGIEVRSPSGTSGTTTGNLTFDATNSPGIASASYKGANLNLGTLTATAGPATTLSLSPDSGSVTAGSERSLTVTARDAGGNLASTIPGGNLTLQAHTSNQDANAVYGALTGTGSTRSGGVTFKTSGTRSVVAKNSTLTSSAATFTVNPSTLASLEVSGPAAATTATPTNYTVTGKDVHGNVVASLAAVTMSGTQPISTGTQTTQGGTRTIPVTFTKIGTQSLTATAGSVSSNPYSVSVSPAVVLAVTSMTPNVRGQGAGFGRSDGGLQSTLAGEGLLNGTTAVVHLSDCAAPPCIDTTVTMAASKFANAEGTEAKVRFAVDPEAVVGMRDIVFTGPDGQMMRLNNAFQVAPSPRITSGSFDLRANSQRVVTLSVVNLTADTTITSATTGVSVSGVKKNLTLGTLTLTVKAADLASGPASLKIWNTTHQGVSESAIVNVLATEPVVAYQTNGETGGEQLPTLNRGVAGQTFTIEGGALSNTSQLKFSGSGITVTQKVLQADGSLAVTVNVTATAVVGERYLTVTNADGTYWLIKPAVTVE